MPLRYPEVSFVQLYHDCLRSGEYKADQYESEIIPLLQIIHKRQFQALLEIGTSLGGTSFLLTRAAHPRALILTLDLEIDPVRKACVQSFALDQQRVVSLQGNSHSPASAEKVVGELAGRALDFVLIDGDHSADAVRKDFELYAPLVTGGGIVAFHDICLPTSGVMEFWNQIKRGQRYEELIADARQQFCGLGLLYV